MTDSHKVSALLSISISWLKLSWTSSSWATFSVNSTCDQSNSVVWCSTKRWYSWHTLCCAWQGSVAAKEELSQTNLPAWQPLDSSRSDGLRFPGCDWGNVRIPGAGTSCIWQIDQQMRIVNNGCIVQHTCFQSSSALAFHILSPSILSRAECICMMAVLKNLYKYIYHKRVVPLRLPKVASSQLYVSPTCLTDAVENICEIMLASGSFKVAASVCKIGFKKMICQKSWHRIGHKTL